MGEKIKLIWKELIGIILTLMALLPMALILLDCGNRMMK